MIGVRKKMKLPCMICGDAIEPPLVTKVTCRKSSCKSACNKIYKKTYHQKPEQKACQRLRHTGKHITNGERN